jgi:hypothetical protein
MGRNKGSKDKAPRAKPGTKTAAKKTAAKKTPAKAADVHRSKYVYAYRDSVTGEFCRPAYAAANPGTTTRHRELRVGLPVHVATDPDMHEDAPDVEPLAGHSAIAEGADDVRTKAI